MSLTEGTTAPDLLSPAAVAAAAIEADRSPKPSNKPRPRLRMPRRRFHNPLGTNLSLSIGVVLLAFYVLVAIISLVWTPYDPKSLTTGLPYTKPGGLSHLFGTDRLGGDVLSRAMSATKLDLFVVVIAVLIALVVGSAIGTLAGYFGRWADGTIMRCLEVFQAFPAFLLAMLVVQAAGPGVFNVVIVLAVIGVPDYLRLSRAGVLAQKNLQFVEAAKMAGNGSLRIAFRHLLPNVSGPLLAQTSVNAGWAVLVTSSLGFLGIGIPADTPEWGAMIANGRDGIVLGQWWMSFFPGLLVLGLAAGLYLLGDGLADVLDKRRRS